jgi:hypothetical protein
MQFYQMAQSTNRHKELWAVLGVIFGMFAVIILPVLPNLLG